MIVVTTVDQRLAAVSIITITTMEIPVRKAVATVADIVGAEDSNEVRRPHALDRMAVDQQFDDEFLAGIGGVENKAGERPALRPLQGASQMPAHIDLSRLERDGHCGEGSRSQGVSRATTAAGDNDTSSGRSPLRAGQDPWDQST